jgi:integrase
MLTKRGGVWRLDVRLPDGARIRKSLGTTDRAQAALMAPDVLQQEIKRLKDNPEKIAQSRGSITLGTAFRRAMKEREEWRASKSPKTLEGNFKLITEHIPEDTDLATITFPMMLTYAETLRAEDCSPSTINQRLSLISVLISEAATVWGLPIAPYKMPRMKIAKGRIKTVSYEEEEKVIALFAKCTYRYHEDMADLVPCLVDTGFRLSEMLRLDVNRDVSWEENTVQCWVNKADHPRIVPMTARVRTILARRASMGRPFGMLTIFSAAVCWQWVREQMGLTDDKEFVIHALRHTTASRLARAGMDAFRIMKWMGHKSITTTQLYVTLFGKDLGELADALEKRPAVPKNVPKSGLKTGHSGGFRLDNIKANQGVIADYGGWQRTHNPLVPCSTHGRPTRIFVNGIKEIQAGNPAVIQEVPETVPTNVPMEAQDDLFKVSLSATDWEKDHD